MRAPSLRAVERRAPARAVGERAHRCRRRAGRRVVGGMGRRTTRSRSRRSRRSALTACGERVERSRRHRDRLDVRTPTVRSSSGAISPAAAERIAMAAATVAAVCASACERDARRVQRGRAAAHATLQPVAQALGLAGNLLVSVLASLPFVYGSYAAGHWQRGVPLRADRNPAPSRARAREGSRRSRGGSRLAPHRFRSSRGVLSARVAIVAALVASRLRARVRPRPAREVARRFSSPRSCPAMLALALRDARARCAAVPGSPAFFKLAMVCAMAALLVARA